MAVECGEVVEIKADKVRISASPNSGCETCASKSHCVMIGQGKMRSIWMNNDINAEMGDIVEFSIGERATVGISFLFYIIPVIFLFAGMAFGIYEHKSFNLEKDAAAAIFGIIAFIVSGFSVRFISKQLEKNKHFRPSLVRKVTESE